MARTERDALCDLALRLGEEKPTLSGEWTVKDLVVHLLIREGSPAAVGITVPQLAGVTAAASRRLAKQEFPALVERLRSGPPAYSPLRVPVLDKAANTMEYFIHHEDIRRAQPGWVPRKLHPRQEDALWKGLRVGGKGLVRKAKIGVVVERTDTGEKAVLKQQQPSVVVRGLASELALYVYGRKEQSQVEVDGNESSVAALDGTDLGI